MNSLWTTKWKKAAIWFSGYISFLALVLLGGYFITKTDDEELKKTTKLSFFVTLIFAAISGFISIITNIGNMFDNFYYTAFYDVCDVISRLNTIAEIIVFTVFILLAFFKTSEKPVSENTDSGTEG